MEIEIILEKYQATFQKLSLVVKVLIMIARDSLYVSVTSEI